MDLEERDASHPMPFTRRGRERDRREGGAQRRCWSIPCVPHAPDPFSSSGAIAIVPLPPFPFLPLLSLLQSLSSNRKAAVCGTGGVKQRVAADEGEADGIGRCPAPAQGERGGDIDEAGTVVGPGGEVASEARSTPRAAGEARRRRDGNRGEVQERGLCCKQHELSVRAKRTARERKDRPRQAEQDGMGHAADALRTGLMTITRHVLNEQSRHPASRGDLTILLSHIVLGFKFVSSAVNKADLAKLIGL